MARFVLVHGAFSGAWIWDVLIARLEALGHTGEAFDLPGLGDDRTPVRDVTLGRRMAKENACADVVEIDTDHTPQLSRPDELAKALDRFAKHVAHRRS